jgi:hypothetical protein
LLVQFQLAPLHRGIAKKKQAEFKESLAQRDAAIAAAAGEVTGLKQLVVELNEATDAAEVGRCRLMPIKPTSEAPGTKRSKLECGATAFKFLSQNQLAPLHRGPCHCRRQ